MSRLSEANSIDKYKLEIERIKDEEATLCMELTLAIGVIVGFILGVLLV